MRMYSEGRCGLSSYDPMHGTQKKKEKYAPLSHRAAQRTSELNTSGILRRHPRPPKCPKTQHITAIIQRMDLVGRRDGRIRRMPYDGKCAEALSRASNLRPFDIQGKRPPVILSPAFDLSRDTLCPRVKQASAHHFRGGAEYPLPLRQLGTTWNNKRAATHARGATTLRTPATYAEEDC